jgi:hypothetical protein
MARVDADPGAADWLTEAVGREDYVRFYCVTQSSSDAAQAWQPQNTDVLVVTHSKTGTTLLQQLIQMVRSRGDTSFDEITAVQPWPDFCADIGIDVDAPQPHHPRVFKSHQRPAAINRGARLASVVRDPAAVVTSYYSFYVAKDHPLVRGKTLDQWATELAHAGTPHNGTLWDYYLQLWRCRCAALGAVAQLSDVAERRAAASAAPMLLLEYGALAADLPSHAQRIAEWLGGGGGGRVDTSNENVARAAQLASREAMAAAACQFDDHFLYEKGTAAGCAHVMQMAQKVLPLGAARPQLSAATEELLAATWRERVAPCTGHASYADLAHALAKDHGPWR